MLILRCIFYDADRLGNDVTFVYVFLKLSVIKKILTSVINKFFGAYMVYF